jgi:hypothetical protein
MSPDLVTKPFELAPALSEVTVQPLGMSTAKRAAPMGRDLTDLTDTDGNRTKPPMVGDTVPSATRTNGRLPGKDDYQNR